MKPQKRGNSPRSYKVIKSPNSWQPKRVVVRVMAKGHEAPEAGKLPRGRQRASGVKSK